MDLYHYTRSINGNIIFTVNNIFFSNVYFLNNYSNFALRLTIIAFEKRYSMRQLNIEETKLKIIEQLIILNDDSFFEKVENLINESLQRPKSTKLSKQ